ncbi:hypothetical protein C8Q70DRAFT_922757 [Cubamyces menziesii]|nr:hypothetical protein C8Q70DRAFT_922757 [Cubamyces menziesii]
MDPSLFSSSSINGTAIHAVSASVGGERAVIASSHPRTVVVPNPVARPPRPPPPPFIPKQPLTTPPPIWAESRQEVCESFDWFRSYQGGVYFNSDMVKGYLLSAFSSKRDVFARGGRLIISHGGGRAESIHNKKGQTALQKAEDQREEDKSVRALLRTYQMKRPLVLLIDDRYALFPYDLATKGYTYVVLGFYHIVHAWAEREFVSNDRHSVIRWKFAFEWCEKQRAPWWLQNEHPNALSSALAKRLFTDEYCRTADPHHGLTTITYICPSCTKASPLVYQAWMCLHPTCVAFWTLADGRRPPEELHYDGTFLESSHPCYHDVLEDLAPIPPATQALDGVVTSRRFCKGWHCKQCGRLSCRSVFKWEYWECQNCHATVQIAGKTRIAKEFWGQTNPDFLHHKVAEDSGTGILRALSPGISKSTCCLRIGEFASAAFTRIPKAHPVVHSGRIYLIIGSPIINRAADEIFGEYQEQAGSGQLRFRRWPLRSHQCRGTLLTNYFSQNTGEPYRYVGGTANTVPFNAAPSAVVKARDLIQDRMNSVIQAEQSQYTFNEVLSAAYMEKQKMAFHSDAERGLGPRVASLSLGSSAYMHFRLLKKYRTDKGSGASQNAMTLFLRHGDVLIMDGAGIQEYYEHTVVPLNFRIAATARYIGAP